LDHVTLFAVSVGVIPARLRATNSTFGWLSGGPGGSVIGSGSPRLRTSAMSTPVLPLIWMRRFERVISSAGFAGFPWK
jgi:hypothetical protein